MITMLKYMKKAYIMSVASYGGPSFGPTLEDTDINEAIKDGDFDATDGAKLLATLKEIAEDGGITNSEKNKEISDDILSLLKDTKGKLTEFGESMKEHLPEILKPDMIISTQGLLEKIIEELGIPSPTIPGNFDASKGDKLAVESYKIEPKQETRNGKLVYTNSAGNEVLLEPREPDTEDISTTYKETLYSTTGTKTKVYTNKAGENVYTDKETVKLTKKMSATEKDYKNSKLKLKVVKGDVLDSVEKANLNKLLEGGIITKEFIEAALKYDGNKDEIKEFIKTAISGGKSLKIKDKTVIRLLMENELVDDKLQTKLYSNKDLLYDNKELLEAIKISHDGTDYVIEKLGKLSDANSSVDNIIKDLKNEPKTKLKEFELNLKAIKEEANDKEKETIEAYENLEKAKLEKIKLEMQKTINENEINDLKNKIDTANSAGLDASSLETQKSKLENNNQKIDSKIGNLKAHIAGLKTTYNSKKLLYPLPAKYVNKVTQINTKKVELGKIVDQASANKHINAKKDLKAKNLELKKATKPLDEITGSDTIKKLIEDTLELSKAEVLLKEKISSTTDTTEKSKLEIQLNTIKEQISENEKKVGKEIKKLQEQEEAKDSTIYSNHVEKIVLKYGKKLSKKNALLMKNPSLDDNVDTAATTTPAATTPAATTPAATPAATTTAPAITTTVAGESDIDKKYLNENGSFKIDEVTNYQEIGKIQRKIIAAKIKTNIKVKGSYYIQHDYKKGPQTKEGMQIFNKLIKKGTTLLVDGKIPEDISGKDNIKAIQALILAKYDNKILGKWGIDGYKGTTTKNAIKKYNNSIS